MPDDVGRKRLGQTLSVPLRDSLPRSTGDLGVRVVHYEEADETDESDEVPSPFSLRLPASRSSPRRWT